MVTVTALVVASLLAASLMGPGSQGKGAAVALSGLTVANLVGVPMLTALGQAAGWRAAFLTIAAVFAPNAVTSASEVPVAVIAAGESCPHSRHHSAAAGSSSSSSQTTSARMSKLPAVVTT